MKKLRVTWWDGSWGCDAGRTTVSRDLPLETERLDGAVVIAFSGDDQHGDPGVLLTIPKARLVSAVQVEVEDA